VHSSEATQAPEGEERVPALASEPGAKADSERLPASIKLYFAAPSFAGAAMAIPIGVLMPRFYSDVVLVPLGYIALAIAVARALDALTDPLMGWLSDRTQTRWGRRKPYMFVGAPLAALCFLALFTPPVRLGPIQASVWFGVMFGLWFLFHTVYDVPRNALGAELTLDYNERSRLFGVQSIFIALGTIVASVLPAFMQQGFRMEDERQVYFLMASFYAALLVGLYALLLMRVPERPEFARRESYPLVPGIRRALRNRPFRILLSAGIINAIPAAIPAILLPYFVIYVIQPEASLAWVGRFLVIYLGTGMLFVPLWTRVAQRVGKLNTLVMASSIGIAGSVLYFFVGKGDVWFAASIYFITGIQSAAHYFLIPAMTADIIDYDELRTGKRREAQYGAFLGMIPKFVAIPGSSIPLAILAASGFVPNQVQTEQVDFVIRFMYSIFPAGFYVTAVLIVMRYPISREAHVAIRDGIATHARGETSVDPLTGAELPPVKHRRIDEETGWFLDHFSLGELNRVLTRGPARLVSDVVRMAGLSLVVCLTATWVTFWSLSGVDTKPGPTSVISVVVAGLALTAFLFHLMRLGPARRMAADPRPADEVRAHRSEQA
jgi:GPH family glycoside/pentoside/hexuronide:cation symporter